MRMCGLTGHFVVIQPEGSPRLKPAPAVSARERESSICSAVPFVSNVCIAPERNSGRTRDLRKSIPMTALSNGSDLSVL